MGIDSEFERNQRRDRERQRQRYGMRVSRSGQRLAFIIQAKRTKR
jgi:hypothetical protein